MPRARSYYLVVAFGTTTDALAMEQVARERGLLGRLAPIPRQLSAGCGLAWREPAANEAHLRQIVRECGIAYERMELMEL